MGLIRTDVSEEYISSIYRVERVSERVTSVLIRPTRHHILEDGITPVQLLTMRTQMCYFGEPVLLIFTHQSQCQSGLKYELTSMSRKLESCAEVPLEA